MKRGITAVVFTALFSISCSSVKTVDSPSLENSDGLFYYMPRKDLIVTITVGKEATAAEGKDGAAKEKEKAKEEPKPAANGGKPPVEPPKDKKASQITKVDIGTTAAYPDIKRRYLLRLGANAVDKSILEVGISEAGLLTSTKSTTLSSATEAFKNLVTSVTQARLLTEGLDKKPPEKTCTKDGPHTFVFEFAKSHSANPCGLSLNIEKLGDLATLNRSAPKQGVAGDGNKGNDKEKNTDYSGLFYRQNIPYLITVSGDGLNASRVVLSPSQSPTYFLPVSRSFFSNNKSDFGFADGVPTKYNQETEGEAVALLKLPAEIIGAYFAAIGSIFDSFKTTDTKEAAVLAESLKLELAKMKYDACIAAIQANDSEKIKELACQ